MQEKNYLYESTDILNEVTAAAIAEGRRIAFDKNVKGYTNMEDLKADLEE